MQAVIIKNLTKKYSLSRERPIFLKSLFFSEKKTPVFALKKISISVNKGESVGIIGENGSGKSTLLKIIAGITKHNSGSIKIAGSVGSLIELGAGFHPDLTGEENIYLNAALLGFSKRQVEEKFRSIVEFADIGNYIKQPVRTYSSGMVIRLAFAVAVHLDPDILLIDEVFSVGDERFQKKSIAKISDFQKNGKTLILVSHNLFLIKELCKKVYLLSKGKIVKSGSPTTVINFYLHHYQEDEDSTFKKRGKKGKVYIKQVEFTGKDKKRKTKFKSREPIYVTLKYQNTYGEIETSFGLSVSNEEGLNLYGFSTDPIPTSKGVGEVTFKIFNPPPIEGALYFSFGISDLVRTIRYDSVESQEIEILAKPSFYKGVVNFDCRYEHKRLL